MDRTKNNGGRAPLADISNTIEGDQDQPNYVSPIIDAKERKKQRDRERYASMSDEKRNEVNKKRREARQRNKGRPMMPGPSTDTQHLHMNQTSEAIDIEASGDMATGSDNCSIVDFTNLTTDDTSGPNNNISPAGNSIERKRQRDRERHATMSVEQRDEKNKKRREARQRIKGRNVTPNVLGDGDIEENMDPDDDNDWLHRNETYQANDTITTRDLPTSGKQTPSFEIKWLKVLPT